MCVVFFTIFIGFEVLVPLLLLAAMKMKIKDCKKLSGIV